MPRADNLTTFMCRLSRNSGSLYLPKPWGHLQVCNGLPLPLPYRYTNAYTSIDTDLITGSSSGKGVGLCWVQSSLGTLAIVSGVPRNFFGGSSTNSVEDRENGELGAVDPLVRGSGGSCNLVQEISFHIVTFS